MRKSHHQYGFKLLAGASFLALSSGVAAQSTDSDDNVALEEIIVTAQKRVESAQDVPVSVAAVAGEKLDVLKSGGLDIRFLSSRVPSLTIESSFGRTFPRFYIRGLGNTDFDFNASQPVSLIYDDVVFENPILKGFPVFDTERIEVIRGPQGTLFGRNTPAGIVKFDSAKPTHETDGYGRVSYGRFNTVQLEGAVGGSIIDDVLAARLSVLYQRRDGFVDNTFTGVNNDLEGFNDFAIRGQLLYTPTEEFTALLNVHGRTLDGTARVFRANAIEPGTNDFVEGFDRFEVATDGQNDQAVNSFGWVANLSYDFGDVTLTSISAYETAEAASVGDVDGGNGGFGVIGVGTVPFDAETEDAVPTLDQYTQEIRLSSNNWETVNFQVGAFYFNEDFVIQSTNFATLFGGGVNGFASQTQAAESVAGFASVDVNVTDDLVIKGGIRITYDEKDFTARRTLSPLAFLGVGPLPLQQVSVDDTFVNWDVSATYAVNDEINIFGRIATSSRAPSIQGRVLFGDVVSVADTEDIISFEAGVKAELFERRVRFNLTGFYYDLDDQQVTAVGGATNFNTLLNVEDSRGFGFEAEVEALITEDFLVTAGVSLNDTEFQDPNLGVVPGAAAGITVLDPDPDGDGVVSIDGNPFPQAPRWIANLTARYSIPVTDDVEFYVFTDWAYRSQINFVLYESVELNDDVLIEGGFRAGYVWNEGEYELAGFVRNLTNNLSLNGVIDFNNLTGFVNEPRTWGVEFIARF